MENGKALVSFENYKIRRLYDEKTDTMVLFFVDVVAVLTESINSRDYWFRMKVWG